MRSCPSSLRAGSLGGYRGDNRVANPARIRLGSWNVVSLTRKSHELVHTFVEGRVDIVCVQETRWKGEGATRIKENQLWFSGSRKARNRVGINMGSPYRDNVVNEETFMVISAYAPHVGLGEEDKRRFWKSLDEVVRGCPTDHSDYKGDLNGHIGASAEGYAGAHSGFGYGVRNEEGCSIPDFRHRP
ncbi:uncharacterized protein [Rutidosis leptorrhynchoides]|uniref:uncharacterized protein n=1 Tax=Rutidosis leptorrhynchoides TaxID=125765 RepID=UPI003A9A111B